MFIDDVLPSFSTPGERQIITRVRILCSSEISNISILEPTGLVAPWLER